MLRTKIHDLQEAQQFLGYKPKLNEEPRNAVSILSKWFNLPPTDYCEMILAWMEENIWNHPVALKWSLRGQDWPYYHTALHTGSALDGLEFWAASRASGFHLNLVQQGQVWSSRISGTECDDFTLMVLEDSFVYCDCVNGDQGLGLESRGKSDEGNSSP